MDSPLLEYAPPPKRFSLLARIVGAASGVLLGLVLLAWLWMPNPTLICCFASPPFESSKLGGLGYCDAVEWLDRPGHVDYAIHWGGLMGTVALSIGTLAAAALFISFLFRRRTTLTFPFNVKYPPPPP